MTIKILRRKQVEDLTGLSRSSIYNLMKQRKFPASISISPRCVGWLSDEIEQYIQQRIDASRTNQEGR